MQLLEPTDEPPEPVVRDDLLRLIFTCCHPSLETQSQIALSLRWLCGLSTAEVARAMLVTEPAMAKRLTRARRKITVAGIPYRVPDAADLPDRLAGVLRTVYLAFNEGYSATSGDRSTRRELIDESLRLCRLLHELLPDDAGVMGLLALVLLQSSRTAARFDARGAAVLLPDQDRSLWSRDAIEQGVGLVGRALARTPHQPNRYAVEAAIAACHALAPSWSETDWAAIVSWYDVLLIVDDSPVVRLNRAVAVAELHGPAAGLAELAEVQLDGYPLLPATRAELLHRLGRDEAAIRELNLALELPLNDAQRRHLERRLAELQ
jgi:predicted RNA polymerase sigma factor